MFDEIYSARDRIDGETDSNKTIMVDYAKHPLYRIKHAVFPGLKVDAGLESMNAIASR